ncbi:HSD17B2 [Mytilus coruscus]|uniref:HSD17B2 n=1 Tax=Mytilus coruscus TaxID=42192 RepID=A0A6J8DZ65_MYTCO|nr:HSD17B2 [Mytilus coruscus]
MNTNIDYDEYLDDDIIFYSVLYSSVTVLFAMAVLSKFLTNEFRFGFRSVLSLAVLFLGEPLCQFFIKGPSGVFAFAMCCLVIYSILPASHLPVGNKAVLVTGCDSGFGNSLVKKLDSIGMRVFATCLSLNSPGAVSLQLACSGRLLYQTLNSLWGLVNNAGVWYYSELETTSETIFRKVLEINLFGAIRLTKALLPLIRKSKGRIVNVSSLMGRLTMEGNGAYSMSKHALLAFSDTLRQEMKKWGVHVSIIEPTGFYTENMKEHVINSRKAELWDTMDEETKVTYGQKYFDSIYESIIEGSNRYPDDLTCVIRAMRSGLLSKRPRNRYPCGTGADFIMMLYPLLPVWLADKLISLISIMPKDVRPAGLD